MKRPLFALASALCLCVTAAGRQPAKDGNAAVDYWRAIYLMLPAKTNAIADLDWEKVGNETDPQKLPQEFKHAAAEVSDDAVRALIRASRTPRCDFQIEYELGVFALLPHLAPMRTAARMLRVDARRHLADGDAPGAADRLVAAIGMARHTKNDHLLISDLVGIAIVSNTLWEIEAEVASGKLTPDTKRTLLLALEPFTKDDPFGMKDAIATGERDLTGAWIKRTFHGPAAGKDLLATGIIGLGGLLEGGSPPAPAPAAGPQKPPLPPSPPPAPTKPQAPPEPSSAEKAKKAIDAMNGDQLAAAVDLMEPFYKQLLDAYDQPDGVARLTAIGEAAGNGQFGPLCVFVAPATCRARLTDYKARAHIARILEMLGR